MFFSGTGDDPILGAAQYSTQDVVNACESVLRAIRQNRRKIRRDYVRNYIETYEKKSNDWWRFWIKEKTKTQLIKLALKAYFNPNKLISPSYHEFSSCSLQKHDCLQILRMAKNTKSSTVWLTPEAVRVIFP